MVVVDRAIKRTDPIGNFVSGLEGRWAALIVASICFLAGISITFHFAQLVSNELTSQQKREAVANLSEARARLEGEMSRTVAHGIGIRAYVAQFDGMPFNAAHYLEIATELIEANPSIRSIGLAPGNILRAIYPLSPNEAVLGLDYKVTKTQWPAVRQAMETRKTVIAGPLQLVQGGRALMIRIPVFPASYPGQPMNDRAYWGVASLILDETGLMAAANLKPVMNGVRIAITDKNAADASLDVVFGDQSIRERDHVSLPLHLPGGLDWDLIGYAEGGWSGAGGEIWFTRLAGIVISLGFAAMAYLLVKEVQKVRSLALHDPLTGLANRRLLSERMQQLAAMCDRSDVGFDIFYVDLDGFKSVNDNYGHSAGDRLLIETGQRLRDQVRRSDTVARIGGDEFIVLTHGNMRPVEKSVFVERLSEQVAKRVEHSGKNIDVNASIGNASYPSDAASIEELLKVADGRMYAQKTKSHQISNDILGKGVLCSG